MALESYNGPQLDDVTPPPRDFEGLDNQECVDQITEWFFKNFEDPTHHDMYISAEGGYQYIWGGPYDASEILWEAFDDHVSKDIIEAAIEELQRDGTFNWTVAHSRIQPPEEDEDIDPSFLFNEMQRRISELENILASLPAQSVGIGHNNPPEPLEDMPITNIDIQNIVININILKSQKVYAVEKKEQVRGAIKDLSSISAKLGSYFAEKGREFIDEAVKAAGAELGKRGAQAGVLYAIYDLLEKIVHLASSWSGAIF